jgi:hypothetical protein
MKTNNGYANVKTLVGKGFAQILDVQVYENGHFAYENVRTDDTHRFIGLTPILLSFPKLSGQTAERSRTRIVRRLYFNQNIYFLPLRSYHHLPIIKRLLLYFLPLHFVERAGVRSFTPQARNRVLQCSLHSLEADSKHCDSNGQYACNNKYPPGDICAVRKILQPFIHKPPGNRDGY